METMQAIVRHSPPTIWDGWPKGTICISVINKEDQWIQRSDNPEKPRWEKL